MSPCGNGSLLALQAMRRAFESLWRYNPLAARRTRRSLRSSRSGFDSRQGVHHQGGRLRTPSGCCQGCGGPLFERTCFVCRRSLRSSKGSHATNVERAGLTPPGTTTPRCAADAQQFPKLPQAGSTPVAGSTFLRWRATYVSNSGVAVGSAIMRAFRVNSSGDEVQLRQVGGSLLP